MGKILVAYDGSENAKKALNHALELSEKDDEIIVLYVISSSGLKEFVEIDPVTSKSRAHEIVNIAVESLKSRGTKAIGLVKEGDIADEIIRTAEELNCSKIVIGSAGSSEKVGTFMLGSIADIVVRRANRPVVIVR